MWYPRESITDADNADDLALFANTPSLFWGAWYRQQEALVTTRTQIRVYILIQMMSSPHQMTSL